MIYIQLDLLAHQRRSLGVAEQLTQHLAVGGVHDQRAYLQDAGDTLFLEGKNVLVFFAALQGHRAVPQAGNGEHRLCAVIDVLGTQVLGFAHLAETFIAGSAGAIYLSSSCLLSSVWSAAFGIAAFTIAIMNRHSS